ncbi:MAG: hypothetical protein GXP50_10660 [Deltaproteobacteria bacterium]|nr:hypothetical protein [Deltaproteobacteria bacterium]
MTRMLMGLGAVGGFVGVLAERPLALSPTETMLLLGASLVIGAASVRFGGNGPEEAGEGGG